MKPVEIDRKDQRDYLSRLILEEIRQSRQAVAKIIDQLDEDKALYDPRPVRKDPPWKGACDLQVSTCKYVRDNLLARIYRALIAQNPIFHVNALNPEDKDEAARVSQFLNAQAEVQLNLRLFLRRAVHTALEDGLAVVYVGWRQERAVKPRWGKVEVLPGSEGTSEPIEGEIQPLFQEKLGKIFEDVVVYDGPDLKLLNIRDWGVYPATCADVDESPLVWMRYVLTGDQIIERVYQGHFDKNALDELVRWDGERVSTVDDEFREVSSGALVAGPFRSRQFQFVEVYRRMLIEEIGESKEDKKPVNQPGQDWRIIMHEDSGLIFSAHPSPWWDQKRPFALIRPFPDKFGVFGESVTDKAGDFQRALTALLRLFIDGTAMRVAPRRVYQRGLLSPMEREELEKAPPNALMELDYPDSLKLLEAGDAIGPSMPVFEAVRQMAERATGVTDVNMAIISGRSRTATEVTETLAESDTFFSFVVDQVADGISRLGDLILSRDYQFLGNSSIQELWAYANPPQDLVLPDGTVVSSAQQIQDSFGTLGLEELSKIYKVEAAGSAETANSAIRARRAQQAFLTLRTEPLVNRDPRFVYRLIEFYIREVLKEDPERFIGTLEKSAQDMLFMQQLALQQQQQAEPNQIAPETKIAGQENGDLLQSMLKQGQIPLGQEEDYGP